VRLECTFPADTTSTSTKTEAPALVLGGTFVILATVNGAAQAAMRVDSGATDVMLPRTVAARLISAGSLTPADYVITKTYRLADGSLRTQKVYRLRSLKVGTFIVHDIPCTISNGAARAETDLRDPTTTLAAMGGEDGYREIPGQMPPIFAGKSWGIIHVADHALLTVERRHTKNPGGDRGNHYRSRATTEPTAHRCAGAESAAHR